MTPNTKLKKKYLYGDHGSQIMELNWLTPEFYNFLDRQYKHNARTIDNIKYGCVRVRSRLVADRKP